MADNRLVFERVPQLQNMVAFNVAVNLTLQYGGWEDDAEVAFQNSCTRLTKLCEMSIPRALINMIRGYFQFISDEIRAFRSKFLNFCCIGDSNETIAQLLFYISWQPTGKIDQLNTARNLANSAILEESFRLRIMAKFCLKVELENHLNSCPGEFIPGFSDDAMVTLWLRGMDDQYSNQIDERLASRVFLFYNVPAFEYYFNRFDIDKRILFCVRHLHHCDADADFVRFIIHKFTEEEQYRLFFTWNCVAIIFCILTKYESSNFADRLKLWNRIKNMVDGDQYIEILRAVSRYRKYPESEASQNEQEFLVELLRNTPRNLKSYVLESAGEEFLADFIFPIGFTIGATYQRDDRILIEILRDANLACRINFWKREWERIVVRSRSSHLKRIVDLCVPKDEIESFKNSAMCSTVVETYLENLVRNGELSEFEEFLEMFAIEGRHDVCGLRNKLLQYAPFIVPRSRSSSFYSTRLR